MAFKKVALELQSLNDGFVGFDVTLATVDNGDISKSKWDDSSRKDINNIRSLVPVYS